MSRTRTALTASLVTLALTACGAQTTAAPAAKPTPVVTTSKAAVKTAKPAPTTTTPAPVPTSPVALPTSGAPTPSATVSVTPSPTTSPKPHFTTPQAAMTYLATAWNTNDMVNLKHVTQGAARQLLLGMHHEAVNLKLKSCALRKGGNGDYLCTFTHDYPTWIAAKDRRATGGRAEFIAAPSSSVGWYMFAYESCG